MPAPNMEPQITQQVCCVRCRLKQRINFSLASKFDPYSISLSSKIHDRQNWIKTHPCLVAEIV